MRKIPALYAGSPQPRDMSRANIIAMGVGILFGAIHCIACLFEFPSSAEQTLWRISSIGTTGLVVVLLFFFWISVVINPQGSTTERVIRAVVVPSALLYTVGRVIGLTLAFTTLRSLPSGALTNVQWPNFIPHIGA